MSCFYRALVMSIKELSKLSRNCTAPKLISVYHNNINPEGLSVVNDVKSSTSDVRRYYGINVSPSMACISPSADMRPHPPTPVWRGVQLALLKPGKEETKRMSGRYVEHTGQVCAISILILRI